MAKITYETHFKSNRKDGRFLMSMAAFSEKLRREKPKLALPEDLTPQKFEAWRKSVKAKLTDLLCMPTITRQEPPVKLRSEKREDYTVEKWEFYPDEFTVVPFLVLIPDGASKVNKTPAVICRPGSFHSKEFISGEDLLDSPNCRFVKYPERNEMAKYLVKNRMTAFVFDNIATAETGIPTSGEGIDEWNCYSRRQMVYGYLQAGITYPGMSVYHVLSFMQYLSTFDFVDRNRLAVCAHSLGTEAAMALGVISDEIKAVVFNDFLCNTSVSFCSNTEFEEGAMSHDIGIWHTIPGIWKYFDYPDLCAAIAPKFLAFNEGGADEWFETVKRAYKILGKEDRLQISHYPKYSDEKSRKYHGKVPRYGLCAEEFYSWNYCDASDHSFREEPSIILLKKAFENE